MYVPGESGVGRDCLEPIIVQVEQYHLGLCRLQDQISELLNLEAGLERQLQLTSLDHNIWEIQEMHFQRIQHSFPRYDDLFRLLLDRERPDQSSNFLSSLPLGELTETLLSRPHDGMDDLEEELAGTWVEDEDGSVDGLGGQVALECLVDGDPVDVGVVHEPDDLVAEQFSVVLGGQVRFRGLTEVGIKLEKYQDVKCSKSYTKI